MLLYLNNTTFAGEDGQNLAYEVRRARTFGIDVLLVHENDPKRSGCAFNRLFQTTPHDLVEEGVYGKIAVACHPMPFRMGKSAATRTQDYPCRRLIRASHCAVSMAQVAKALGAVPKKTALIETVVFARTTSDGQLSGTTPIRSGSPRHTSERRVSLLDGVFKRRATAADSSE
jgi:hypothetical protein